MENQDAVYEALSLFSETSLDFVDCILIARHRKMCISDRDFQEIFEETIRINTLDYEKYKVIQQRMIDVLDRAEHVEVTGKGENHTDVRISLHTLAQPEKQTNFENCVADINIPLGEVFTSPVLRGTSGLLQVSSVYIGDIQFRNLKMRFEDGMIQDYSCDNFGLGEEEQKSGRELVKQMILKNHDSLPMGEFAIGTNTVAYAMAQKFGIDVYKRQHFAEASRQAVMDMVADINSVL